MAAIPAALVGYLGGIGRVRVPGRVGEHNGGVGEIDVTDLAVLQDCCIGRGGKGQSGEEEGWKTHDGGT